MDEVQPRFVMALGSRSLPLHIIEAELGRATPQAAICGATPPRGLGLPVATARWWPLQHDEVNARMIELGLCLICEDIAKRNAAPRPADKLGEHHEPGSKPPGMTTPLREWTGRIRESGSPSRWPETGGGLPSLGK